MTAQSVKNQTMDFTRAATNQRVKASPSSAGFDQVMDKNLKTNVVNKDKPINKQKTTNSDNVIDKKQEKAFKAKVKEVVDEVIRGQSKVRPDINPEPVSNIEEIGLQDKVIPDDGNLMDETDKDLIGEDQLLAILGSIQQAIMDVLNIDMEELAKQMDDLGIVTADLLNPETLRQLVLNSSGKSELTAFLTDEHLAKSMNELMNNVDTILSDAGIDLPEDELKAFAEKLHNIMTGNNQDLDEIAHNSQQLEEDISKEIQVTDEGLVQDVMRNNALFTDDPIGKNLGQQRRTEQEPNSQSDNKAADIAESKATNGVETRELEFSQADQDDDNSNEMNPNNRFDGFIDQMINASQKTQQVDFVGNEMQITEFREIANQIIEQIKVTVVQDQTSMELQLNPENLGKVNLSVQSKDGVLTAQFVVNNDIVKEAIESQMIDLKNSLEQQGLRVETIEVTVANYSFDQRHESNSSSASKEQQQTRRKITFDEAVNMSELGQDEEIIGNISRELGNQIDYTA